MRLLAAALTAALVLAACARPPTTAETLRSIEAARQDIEARSAE